MKMPEFVRTGGHFRTPVRGMRYDAAFAREPPIVLPTSDNYVDPEEHRQLLLDVGLERSDYEYVSDEQFDYLVQLVLVNVDVFSTDHAKVACAAKVPPHFIELLPGSTLCIR